VLYYVKYQISSNIKFYRQFWYYRLYGCWCLISER